MFFALIWKRIKIIEKFFTFCGLYWFFCIFEVLQRSNDQNKHHNDTIQNRNTNKDIRKRSKKNVERSFSNLRSNEIPRVKDARNG